MTSEEELPFCFGDLEKVFPMQENGLRQTPEACFFHCPVKTQFGYHLLEVTSRS